jgi:hypothetical protein
LARLQAIKVDGLSGDQVWRLLEAVANSNNNGFQLPFRLFVENGGEDIAAVVPARFS